MSTPPPNRAVKRVPCERCGTSTFIPANLGMFQYSNCSNCDHPVMTPVKLDQFELRAVCGSGGMATVYRAHDEILDRDVAVKLMQPEFTGDANAISSEEDGLPPSAAFVVALVLIMVVLVGGWLSDQACSRSRCRFAVPDGSDFVADPLK